MDHFFLDEIMGAFTRIITGGFLTVHPWVMNMMTMMITLMLIAGFFIALIYPTIIGVTWAGQVLLRGLVLVAIANNWLTITDGFLNSVTWLGMQIGDTEISTDEFLSPGRVFYLGTALSWNLFQIMLDLKTDLFWEPVLGISYSITWLLLWACFALMAIFVMTSVIEFQLLSVYAFLMWPFMTVRMLAFLAEPLARTLLGSAMRISALAAMMSIMLPFVVDVGIPTDEMTVQSALALGFGVAGLLALIWQGPALIGASAMPGRGIVAMGALTWVALRRV